MFLKYFTLRMKAVMLAAAGLCLPVISLAGTAVAASAVEAAPMSKFQLMRYVLLGVAILLLFIIVVLSSAVASAGKIYWEREKEKKKNMSVTGIVPLILLALLPVSGMAQTPDALPARNADAIPHDLYLFASIVALEFTIVMVLAGVLMKFLKVETASAKISRAKRFSFKQFFQKINQTVAVEEEHKLDLQHNYDGIRELDNKVPGWWRYAFYASILFGGIYLYRMFIAETLPTQFEELNDANYAAAIQKQEYLKHAANNVDENTVAMLDASGIADGAILYNKNCMACHGDKGQGGVGPNLTDEYWLHQGSLKDIFHSIKYGWPEKGMKPWKDDFSPAQIAQLASYVKSINGTKPPGAKDPQGEIYQETKSIAGSKNAKTKL